jgi:hypothetical protein
MAACRQGADWQAAIQTFGKHDRVKINAGPE